MKKTWVVVSDRTHAKILVIESRKLVVHRELAHPEGRLHDGDFDADRPGRSFDSHGDHRHAMERSEMPSEREAKKFAKEIADAMKHGRMDDGVGRFVLVSEPGFLGILRATLDSHDATLVDGEVRKELTRASNAELTKALSDLFPALL